MEIALYQKGLALVKTFFQILLRFRKNTFGTWNRLEETRTNAVQKAIENNAVEVARLTIAYISIAFQFLPQWVYSNLYWVDLVGIYSLVVKSFGPTRKIPMLVSQKEKDRKDNTVSWEYPGRNLYYMTHTLAKAYGWSVEYIHGLSVDDALAFLQEVFTDEHLAKEFVYGLSEVAYHYNSTTKTSKLVPLPRPYWMLAKVTPIKTFKIRKDLMPQGGIENADQMEELLRRFKEHATKA